MKAVSVMVRRMLIPLRFFSIGLFFTGLVLLSLTPQTSFAQGEQLEVHIAAPYEGEVLYAGPSSLLYKTTIRGWVISLLTDLPQVVVKLEIYHGEELVGQDQQKLGADGTFTFYATVNPAGSAGSFTAKQEWCGTLCHSPGEVALQPGLLRIHVIAEEPGGNRADDERLVTVDNTSYALLPVQLIPATGEMPLSGIKISAASRLYLWRGRSALGMTDDTGYAELRVEALSAARTIYSVEIEPTVIDGVLYEGIRPEELIIPPDGDRGELVRLLVRGRKGRISGAIEDVSPDQVGSLQVLGVQIPEGITFTSRVNPDGTFSLENLPVQRFLLILVHEGRGFSSLWSTPIELDLVQSGQAGVRLDMPHIDQGTLSGAVRDETGNVIPFALVTVESANQTVSVSPLDGTFFLDDLSLEPQSIRIDAPGFFSQRRVLQPLTTGQISEEITITLQRQEGVVRHLASSAEVLVPPETNASIDVDAILLDNGWLWGSSGKADPLMIVTQSDEIKLFNAEFSLASIPGTDGWLYIRNGNAEITNTDSHRTVAVRPGEMIHLNCEGTCPAVPADMRVITAMQAAIPPIREKWEPTLLDRVRDWISNLGVLSAQLITGMVYVAMLAAMIVVPVIWLIRQSRKN